VAQSLLAFEPSTCVECLCCYPRAFISRRLEQLLNAPRGLRPAAHVAKLDYRDTWISGWVRLSRALAMSDQAKSPKTSRAAGTCGWLASIMGFLFFVAVGPGSGKSSENAEFNSLGLLGAIVVGGVCGIVAYVICKFLEDKREENLANVADPTLMSPEAVEEVAPHEGGCQPYVAVESGEAPAEDSAREDSQQAVRPGDDSPSGQAIHRANPRSSADCLRADSRLLIPSVVLFLIGVVTVAGSSLTLSASFEQTANYLDRNLAGSNDADRVAEARNTVFMRVLGVHSGFIILGIAFCALGVAAFRSPAAASALGLGLYILGGIATAILNPDAYHDQTYLSVKCITLVTLVMATMVAVRCSQDMKLQREHAGAAGTTRSPSDLTS
jgi:hypothetical protein